MSAAIIQFPGVRGGIPAGALLLTELLADIFVFRSLSGGWGVGWPVIGGQQMTLCARSENDAWLKALGAARSGIRTIWGISEPEPLQIAPPTGVEQENVIPFPGSQRVTCAYLRVRLGEVWVQKTKEGVFRLGCVAGDGRTCTELGLYRQELDAWLAGITFMEAVVDAVFSQTCRNTHQDIENTGTASPSLLSQA